MNVQELAAKAADVIEARGWARRTFLDDDGRVCALGALDVATGGEPGRPASGYSYGEFYDAIAKKTDKYETLVTWNDREARTREDVIEFFRSIARGES